MVITVNASCGISTAGGFNSATVASSINKHSFAFTTGPNNRCLNNTRATAFSQVPDQANSLQSSFDTNQHFIHHSNSTSHYNQSYLTASTATNNLNSNKITNTPSVNFFLKDELSALTNMYQHQPHHHLAQNSSQLSLPTTINLSSVDSNQTQIAHSTHFNHNPHSFANQHLNHHLDQLNSINSSFNNSSHSSSISSHQNSLSLSTQSSHQQTNSQQIDQAHQSIQQSLDHFNSVDCLHNSSLNAPELSYDFSRLTSSKDNHENRYNLTSVNNLIKKSFKLNHMNEDINEEKKKKDSIKNKVNNKKMNDSSNQFNSNRTSNQIFDLINQNSTHNQSTLLSNDETDKNINLQINQQNIDKDNLSKNQNIHSLNRVNNRSPSNLLLAPNCSNEKDRFFLTETSNILNSNFSLNLLQNNDQLGLSNGQCTPVEYSSPESASSITSNEFNQHENRKNRNTVISSHFKSLLNSEEENPSNNLMNNCEKNLETTKLNNSQNSYSQSTNDLKLLIKPEPDDVRDQTSVSSSENSIYSLETLSNSTEFNGYHSPAHSLLFGHALNVEKAHENNLAQGTQLDNASVSAAVVGSSANLIGGLSTAAAAAAAAANSMQFGVSSVSSTNSSTVNSILDNRANSLASCITAGSTITSNSMAAGRFFGQCNSNNNSSATASKLLLKPSNANGMSLNLVNSNLQSHHHHSSSNNNNGTMNMLTSMGMSSMIMNSGNNSSTTSGLLSGSHGPLSAGSLSGSSSVSSALNGMGGSGKKHHVDKHSDEYKRRRERNNIAVRKSREKAKQRSRDTEKKVNELYNENESLKQKLNIMSKECRVLRQLLANYGVRPDVIESELASIIKSDELQQQLLQQQTNAAAAAAAAAAQHQQQQLAAAAQHQQHQQAQQPQQLSAAVAHQQQHLQQLQQQQSNLFQLHPSSSAAAAAAAAAVHFSPHHNQPQHHLGHY